MSGYRTKTSAPALEREQFARNIVERLMPVVMALAPFGLVVESIVPTWAFDGAFIVLTLFASVLAATYARLPLGPVLLAVLGVVAVALTQRPNIFAIAVIPLVAFILQSVDVRVVMRRFVTVSLTLLVTVLALYYLADFNREYDLFTWRSYSGEFIDRASFGFTHPNRVMMEWGVLAIALLAFSSVRSRLRWFVPIVAVTTFFYIGTDSRTSTILIAGFTLVVVLWRQSIDKPSGVVLRWMAIVMPIAFAFISFSLSLWATEPTINSLLSGRPEVYAGLFRSYSAFEVFGTSAVESEIVDNGFIQLVLSKGLMLATVYLLTIAILVARPGQLSRRSVLIVGAFSALALFETTLLNFAFLFVLLGSLEIDRRAYPRA